MDELTLEKSRYPIGKFNEPGEYSSDYLKEQIEIIASFPTKLRNVVETLSDKQLDMPYRPDGWTIRQVVHHCADSHMNCYIRIKWALTEENPIIKYYFEDRWSEIFDNRNMPIEPSLKLLEGLHFRLAFLMQNLTQSDLEKAFIHPEHDKSFKIKEIIGTYAWHSNHHLAHITELIKRDRV